MKYAKTILEYGLIVILVIIVRLYIITPIQVNQSSMNDTLHNKDIMLLNILSYKIGDIKRFDIVVFNHKGGPLIKRVIGLPGEKVKYVKNMLYINDVYIQEPFLSNTFTDDFDLLDIGYERIPENMYFVLGDNRLNSIDSRYFGLIERNKIIGKANIIIYPFSRLGCVK